MPFVWLQWFTKGSFEAYESHNIVNCDNRKMEKKFFQLMEITSFMATNNLNKETPLHHRELHFFLVQPQRRFPI